MRSIVSLRIFTSLSGSRLRFFITMQIQYAYYFNSTLRLYARNPEIEIVREESVKVYVHMYNGNVQQNPLFIAHL